MEYRSSDIEAKWKKHWEDTQLYKVENKSDKPKYYVLDMFPYPSGAGLHVGHPLGYIASDIYSRYKKLKGFNVLHPMGYDAFGLPAEQYAIETGVHPAVSTDKNIARYRSQLDNIGFSYDWSREVRTSDPKYFKWTQWIFLQLFDHYFCNDSQKARPVSELKEVFAAEGNTRINAATSQETTFSAKDWQTMSDKEKDDVLMNYRLAYRQVTYVNWCEALGTVLANDEVRDGVSERGGYPVERKPMLQWSLRITAYAERLLNDLEELDWSEAMKKMQSNWIGRSEGAQLFFDLEGHDRKIEIYTTRPDTIFGATFMVVAPEHDWVGEITTAAHKKEVEAYRAYVSARSERERMSEVKEVSGAFTGTYALNPFTGKKIPVWISEYVLKDYGTGAIMAVPADDERDHRFAEKYGLEIIPIVDKSNYPGASMEDKVGKMVNSEFLDGMEVPDAIKEITRRIEEAGLGTKKVNYKLRDAIYSRQRYWGEPFPIIYDKEGIAHPMKEEDLPLELPDLDDFKPASGAKSPLARASDWVNLPGGFTRETDTMPGFAGSSWYFLRYMDPQNDDAFASSEALNYWRDVDLYIGGTEHAVGHLLYARFWHKFLHDKGLVPTNEPFKKLINQGMIQGVIENMYMLKEKREGSNHFVCSKVVKERNLEEAVQIPVHVDFVRDYGSQNSWIDVDGLKKFIDWRPEYKDAYFECGKGVYRGSQLIEEKVEGDFGLVTHSEVGKMSKSKYNVINPDEVVAEYGADTFRMYEMFLGPIEQSKPWDMQGISGVHNFLRKLWALFFDQDGNFRVANGQPSREELKILHNAIKRVEDDIERFSFNTCVSHFMKAVNDFKSISCNNRQVLEQFIVLLAPFAPFITEELWDKLGYKESVHKAVYPALNEDYLKEDSIKYPIAFNGKTRTFLQMPADADKEALEKAALAAEDAQKWLEGKTVRKVIVVPGRMINIVVG